MPTYLELSNKLLKSNLSKKDAERAKEILICVVPPFLAFAKAHDLLDKSMKLYNRFHYEEEVRSNPSDVYYLGFREKEGEEYRTQLAAMMAATSPRGEYPREAQINELIYSLAQREKRHQELFALTERLKAVEVSASVSYRAAVKEAGLGDSIVDDDPGLCLFFFAIVNRGVRKLGDAKDFAQRYKNITNLRLNGEEFYALECLNEAKAPFVQKYYEAIEAYMLNAAMKREVLDAALTSMYEELANPDPLEILQTDEEKAKAAQAQASEQAKEEPEAEAEPQEEPETETDPQEEAPVEAMEDETTEA